MAFTQKQIDKFNRQKSISELEKISKNLFRMFRDETISASLFLERFDTLKKKFDAREVIHLESEYHQHLKSYIERLHRDTCGKAVFDEVEFKEIREPEMSNLNRLQKLKNGASYKKDKHKSKHKNEDWGE